jgi:hypothetical protein
VKFKCKDSIIYFLLETKTAMIIKIDVLSQTYLKAIDLCSRVIRVIYIIYMYHIFGKLIKLSNSTKEKQRKKIE